jgi:hypothetical protein
MWISDVDLPAAVIDAHREGRLVLFVGAGASKDSPSGLPLFGELAADVAAVAQVTVTDAQLERPDALLGDLVDRGVDVHSLVATRLRRGDSRPNALHQAIAQLAVVGPSPRIVTTNYDEHLTVALTELSVVHDEYLAPALPMGDDFTGVVYLHGCLRQTPSRLVVTDADFGRAYLRDAWAARFLERMYARYTVLFIGYSHNDVVMSYLGRALGESAPRYALTHDPDAGHWRRLEIHAVGYPVTDRSHQRLPETIAGWAESVSMGMLAHRQRIATLVAGAPTEVPEEVSYLEATLADPVRLPLFTDVARGEDWLAWVTTQPAFASLFDSNATTANQWPLAVWFAEHFVMDEALSAMALRTVRAAGRQLSHVLADAIGARIHQAGNPRPAWLAPWITLLIDDAPQIAPHWLEYALTASRWPEDRQTALLLFDRLTEPKVEFQRAFMDATPRFTVALLGSEHWLREAWTSVLAPRLAEAAPAILAIVDRHLRRAHQLLSATGTAYEGWDPLSFGRSAIEPHEQDRYPDPIDVLIDAARDSIEVLLDAGHPMGAAHLDAWASCDAPLLQRVAVHGWTHRSDVDATTKINWLRERSWLFTHTLHHEVFQLLAGALAAADTEVADAVVTEVEAGPKDARPVGDGREDDVNAYATLTALSWIVEHAPGLESARQALDRVHERHPNFDVGTHPDLLSYLEVGFVPPQPPMTSQELRAQLQADTAGALATLREFEDAHAPFDRPTWEDALGVLAEAVSEDPQVGFTVLNADREATVDFTKAVIRGWPSAAGDASTAQTIVERLTQLDLTVVADDVARLLGASGTDDAEHIGWHEVPAAEELAAATWEALPADEIDGTDSDWLSRAINHPGGWLARFWLRVVASRWRAAGDDWDGLPPDLVARLDAVLDGADERTAMTEVYFASQLVFFFGADRVWCTNRVLPLLDWSQPARARRVWDGFLSWGRWHDQLLNAGLLDQYLAAVRHPDQLRDQLRERLWEHLAAVAMQSEIDPLSWVRDLTSGTDADDRVAWMRQIGWLMTRLPDDQVERQWERWLREYWRERLDSVPLPMSFDEATAAAAWVTSLTSSVADGVALACSRPAGLEEHGDTLHRMSQRVDVAPQPFAELLAHLLASTEQPFWGGFYLAQIVPRLRDAGVDVAPVVEQALRLGILEAANW